jgi:hypothetical protein
MPARDSFGGVTDGAGGGHRSNTNHVAPHDHGPGHGPKKQTTDAKEPGANIPVVVVTAEQEPGHKQVASKPAREGVEGDGAGYQRAVCRVDTALHGTDMRLGFANTHMYMHAHARPCTHMRTHAHTCARM